MFFGLREESWEALAKTIREKDQELFDEHGTPFNQAEQIGASIKHRQDGSGVVIIGH